ncbi:MAG: 4'-phosphopantetheinyl transferase superfamily protein [Proteobacteria bacterium]|nr:4'-phosphopantetheinyl transferase superfamily protein [Pseudomonadota bacterium]
MTTGPGEVHIWYVFYDDLCDPGLLAAYRALLTETERDRHQRFVFERHRHQYLVTRALQRAVLSFYAPVEPGDWRFAAGEYGKPDVCGPPAPVWPRFNLSNTDGLIACAVSTTLDELGVDVEDTTRKTETVDIADHFFSPFEAAALRALPASRHRERFFSYWTLKESYIKARGMGLSLPLDQFSFHLDDGPDIAISFDPRLGDDPAQWRFVLLRASDRHFFAAGARVGQGVDLLLRQTHYIPLSDPPSSLAGSGRKR